MSTAISRTGKWQNGYLIVAIIQVSLVIILLLSLPIWDKVREGHVEATETKVKEEGHVLRLPGILPAMIGFFCYCALESTTGLWGASYLVQAKGINAATAAGWVSMFFLGITIGRFINGLFTLKFSNPVLIRAGQVIIGMGVLYYWYSRIHILTWLD
jgi:fucose permease